MFGSAFLLGFKCVTREMFKIDYILNRVLRLKISTPTEMHQSITINEFSVMSSLVG